MANGTGGPEEIGAVTPGWRQSFRRCLGFSGHASGQCEGTLPVRPRSRKWYDFPVRREPCHQWVVC